MAAVDLYGSDAGQIRNHYQTYLGRGANDDEVTGWLSGTYGGGGLSDWLNQIANSGEAQQYKSKQPQTQPPNGTVVGQNPNTSGPMTVPTNPNSGLPDYSQWYPQIQNWYQQYLGRPGSGKEWEQWASGGYGWGNYQNLAGIEAGIKNSQEAKAYQQPGSGSTGSQQVPGGDYRGWFLNTATAGLAPSGRNLESLGPQLQQYGIKLGPRNASGMIDTVILPDGSRWDVIESATMDGGVRWHWQPAGGHGGVGGGALPGNQYSDPYTQMLEQMIKSRIGVLQGGINDPYRQQYEQAMQARANALAQAEPQYQQLLGYLQKRFEELQGPGYTGAENEAIRTGALDPIESDRNAAKKRVLEQISSRGLDPNSGIALQLMRDVDAEFDAMRGSTQTVLTTSDLQRRESRKQRAEQMGAQLVDIPQARAREQLDVFGALNQLEMLMRNEEEARAREAIGYSGALADLGPQRMQLAMQAAGMGGSPYSMFNSLMQMAQLNQNSALLNSQNSQGLWSGLGSIAAMLSRAGR
jgi:hypothetical protein